MMKKAVKEFNEREIIANRQRFEKKDFQLTETVMRKAGKMGFLKCFCSRRIWRLRYDSYLAC